MSYLFIDNCKDESRRMERLREAFEDPLTECYLLFINHVITLFDGANLQLQTDGPQIHLIHEIYETLYTDLLHLFLTPECVATLDEIDPHSVDYLPGWLCAVFRRCDELLTADSTFLSLYHFSCQLSL